MNKFHKVVLVAALGGLLAIPAVGQAGHKTTHGGSGATGKSCAKRPVVKKAFVVKGTLVSYTADDAATGADEEAVTVTVTRQNRHARNAGLVDSDPTADGTQYSVAGADDAFSVRLAGFEPGESPAAGDKVRILGKVAVTRKRCAAPGTSVADRYGDVNVRKVKIIDSTD